MGCKNTKNMGKGSAVPLKNIIFASLKMKRL
jgi:hypothetical protein